MNGTRLRSFALVVGLVAVTSGGWLAAQWLWSSNIPARKDQLRQDQAKQNPGTVPDRISTREIQLLESLERYARTLIRCSVLAFVASVLVWRSWGGFAAGLYFGLLAVSLVTHPDYSELARLVGFDRLMGKVGNIGAFAGGTSIGPARLAEADRQPIVELTFTFSLLLAGALSFISALVANTPVRTAKSHSEEPASDEPPQPRERAE